MKTHWKKLQNPDYIGAYALEPGQDMILTIKAVVREMVTGPDGKKEECTVAHFIEPVKPMILNSTNSKTIEKLYKTPYIEEWCGRKIQIFSASIKAFGEVVDALRIRPSIPKQTELKQDTPLKCVDCKEDIKPVGTYSAQEIAKLTYEKYGKQLCSDCGAKEKAKQDSQKVADPLANDYEEVKGE